MVEIKSDVNTYISIKHSDNSIPNEMQFIYAKSGYGKSLAFESIIEEYHRAGFLIFILSDVKDEFEFAYPMFEPIRPYHVRHLEKIGKPKDKKKVKLYHPFTFNIPTNQALPDINFYAFSIKSLGRKEWSMIAETAFENDTIRLILNICRNLGQTDGLYSFLYSIEGSTLGIKEEKRIKRDWSKGFGVRSTTATAKSLQDANSFMLPFKTHYFLQPESSPIKLNWEKIMRDQEHYHVFTTYWVEDEKLKDFCILALFNAIIRNKRYLTRPVLIAIPEIRFLVPFKPEGYKKFLAAGMKANLSIMRNQGKGMSFLGDSQVWTDVDENVRNSATFTTFGELGGAADIDRVSKALNYRRELKDQLKKMQYRNSYLVQGMEELETFTLWFPSHMHCEPDYNFFEMYRKYYKDRMKVYSPLVQQIREEFKRDMNKMKDAVERIEKQEKIAQEQKKKLKQEKVKEEQKVEENKVSEVQNIAREAIEKQIYLVKQENPTLSWRGVSKRVGKDHKTCKAYYENYLRRLSLPLQKAD